MELQFWVPHQNKQHNRTPRFLTGDRDTHTSPAEAIEHVGGATDTTKLVGVAWAPCPTTKQKAVVAVSRLETRRGARFDERNRTEPQKGSGTTPGRVGRAEGREMTRARSTLGPPKPPPRHWNAYVRIKTEGSTQDPFQQ